VNGSLGRIANFAEKISRDLRLIAPRFIEKISNSPHGKKTCYSSLIIIYHHGAFTLESAW